MSPSHDESGPSKVRVLAVSSGGGHWVQLLRVLPALQGCDIAFVTVNTAYRSDVAEHRFHVVNDATRWSKIGLLRMCADSSWIRWITSLAI